MRVASNNGLTIADGTDASGFCQYDAVRHQLDHLGFRPGFTLHQLRKEIADYVQKHREAIEVDLRKITRFMYSLPIGEDDDDDVRVSLTLPSLCCGFTGALYYRRRRVLLQMPWRRSMKGNPLISL